MPSAQAVGRWVLTEQPLLEGESPAEIVRRLGAGAVDIVRLAIRGQAPSPPAELTPAARTGIRQALSPWARELLDQED